eukprot:m.1072410 g.1072410  ORF g.1072410 m.1072410 type:complete len:86 (+) comp24231_c0_seq113:5509-5766(+)
MWLVAAPQKDPMDPLQLLGTHGRIATDAAAAQAARAAVQANPEALVVLDANLAPYGDMEEHSMAQQFDNEYREIRALANTSADAR